MGQCFVPDCKHQSLARNCSFFRFPKDKKESERWEKLIKRVDTTPSSSARVCSCHFKDGNKIHGPTIFKTNTSEPFPEEDKKKKPKKTGKRDVNPLSPDYVPSKNHAPSQLQLQKIQEMEIFESKQMMERKHEIEASSQTSITTEGDTTLQYCSDRVSQDLEKMTGQSAAAPVWDHDYSRQLKDSNIINGENKKTHLFPSTPADKKRSIHHNTSVSSTKSGVNPDYVKSLKIECQSLRIQCQNLESETARLMLIEKAFENEDEKVEYYTGLPTYNILMHIFNLICDYLSEQPNLTKFQQLLMTLMRIRLNLDIQDLGYRFAVSPMAISHSFNHVIHIFSTFLIPFLVYWPERKHLKNNLPPVFKNEFSHCVAIIDCFEINFERPNDLGARNNCSHNKSHDTMKYLTAISPLGFISYVTKGYGGEVSDEYVTENCGILDKINPGDVILSDRGFDVSDNVGPRGAKVILSGYTKDKNQESMIDQESMIEVEKTMNLNAVCIHVEKAIGVARQKYKILQSVVPISLLQVNKVNRLTILDEVVRVACGLTNLSVSLVAKDTSVVR